ncbi:PVC-type heme-binding CxxCH protein [Allorhodopirellula solitaria]|uniref:Cytochrome c n=1 Tax=Allorhodopirellula solitaria TaxID=2527987 RepID=A0A5C5XXE5_9BACT|nr:PVC-type heme-binding CxxCH protein [Allorhodopirellula solitaria]TWT67209.1 Cytochrome c [Allorhodopirellula solitaria]
MSRQLISPRLFAALTITIPVLWGGPDLPAADGKTGAPSSAVKHPTLQYDRWSGEINVPDPVAISVDHRGRVFVTQTRRRKIQDLDIRANRDWVADDIGLQSIEDKLAFYHDRLRIGGDQAEQAKHVTDVNKDGQFDWRDLTVIGEVIYRLSDEDGDGKADEIVVFDDDFKTEVTGIAAGVMAWGDDVYATVAPDLWRLTDTDDDGVVDERNIIATGFGLHIAYAGHDMHGLTVGPDGKIYWSIGDKGINATSSEGRHYFYPNQGGVMRCNPDGSDFEVFAHGLRNVQEIAFDSYGNLFGVDNDADQKGEHERFVAIVEGMDAGWRSHYQFRGGEYNPWTDENLWNLPRKHHPAYIIPPISHYVDGPAGFKFNPGTALGPAYADYFFLTSAPNGNQYAFQVRSAGDSFEMFNDHLIGKGPAIVGLAFGPDGALYGADWDGGYPLDQKGAVIRIDVEKSLRHPLRQEVAALLARGMGDRSIAELSEQLTHPDMRIRQAAQFELVKREDTDVFQAVLESPDSDVFAKLHAVWGMGQLARADHQVAFASIVAALKDISPVVRGQAAKTFGETNETGGEPLIPLLGDDDLHVRVHAALALARCPVEAATEELLSAASRLQADQHYLRHAIVSALAACASSPTLADRHDSDHEMERLCAVLALRRQSSPLVSVYLADPSDWIATSAARAIHDDLSIMDALPALAEALSTNAKRSEAFWRRSINANYRIGTAECFRRVLEFASRGDVNAEMRVAACDAAANWMLPPALDRVEGRRRELPVTQRAIDSETAEALLAELASGGNDRVQSASIAAASKLRITLSPVALQSIFHTESLATPLRIEALRSLVRSASDDAETLCLEAIGSSQQQLQLAGVKLLTEEFPQQATAAIKKAFEQTKFLRVRQASIQALGVLEQPSSRQWLTSLADEVLGGSLDPQLHLDVVDALQRAIASGVGESNDGLALRQRADQLRDAAAARSQDNPANAKYVYSRDGGDAASGKRIFNTNVAAQCVRCHRIGKEGSDIGPELTHVASQRDADYLLRAIVSPSADIDPKYKSSAFVLDSGTVLSGVVQSEADDKIVIADAAGKLITIDPEEIEVQVEQKVSLMPAMDEVLSASQVRDVVAYLRSLR